MSTKKVAQKEVKDRKPLKKEEDEELIPIEDVLGTQTKPFGYTGINPKKKGKQRKKGSHLL